VLTLEQVYGALTFYLANKSEVDAYLGHSETEFEAMRKAAREQDPMFYQKLADARRRAAWAHSCMKIRFQADADLNQIILLATIRQEPAVDFQTAIAAGLASRRSGGIDESRERGSSAGDLWSKNHASVFFWIHQPRSKSRPDRHSQSLSVATAAEDLILIWSATEAKEWINRIGILPLWGG
jgi:hypothetical protein